MSIGPGADKETGYTGWHVSALVPVWYGTKENTHQVDGRETADYSRMFSVSKGGWNENGGSSFFEDETRPKTVKELVDGFLTGAPGECMVMVSGSNQVFTKGVNPVPDNIAEIAGFTNADVVAYFGKGDLVDKTT